MVMMAVRVLAMRRRVFTFRLGCHGVVVVPQARSHSYRPRSSDHRAGSEQNQRASKTRHLCCPTASTPPCCTHDDIALEQQCTDAGGLHRFRFTGVWAEWHAHGPRPNPKDGDPDVGKDPDSQHRHRRTDPSNESPNQLEHRDRGKEEPCGQPIPPVRRKDGEVDHRRANRSNRRGTSSQPDVGLRVSFGVHRPDDDRVCDATRAANRNVWVPDRHRAGAQLPVRPYLTPEGTTVVSADEGCRDAAGHSLSATRPPHRLNTHELHRAGPCENHPGRDRRPPARRTRALARAHPPAAQLCRESNPLQKTI